MESSLSYFLSFFVLGFVYGDNSFCYFFVALLDLCVMVNSSEL